MCGRSYAITRVTPCNLIEWDNKLLCRMLACILNKLAVLMLARLLVARLMVAQIKEQGD